MNEVFVFRIWVSRSKDAAPLACTRILEIRQPPQDDATFISTVEGMFDAALLSRVCQLRDQVQANAASTDDIDALGETLFDLLFTADLSKVLLSYFDRTEANAKLRIEIEIDAKTLTEIASLPWEFLKIPYRLTGNRSLLAAAPNVSLSRRAPRSRETHRFLPGRNETLRALMIACEPSGLGPVEYDAVYNSLKSLEASSNQLCVLPLQRNIALQQLDHLLELHKPHILHFIGHAQFSANRGEVALVDITGGPEWVEATRFGEAFTRCRPTLVFLQACESAASASVANPFAGVASQLIQQDVPMAVAMQYRIRNYLACEFAIKFYQRLLGDGENIDMAVQEGRRALHLRNTDPRAFATPVLFRRTSGRLREDRDSALERVGRYKKQHDVCQQIDNTLRFIYGQYLSRSSLMESDWVSVTTHFDFLESQVKALIGEGQKEPWAPMLQVCLDSISKAIQDRSLHRVGSVCSRLRSSVRQRADRTSGCLRDVVTSDRRLSMLEEMAKAHDNFQLVENHLTTLTAPQNSLRTEFEICWEMIGPPFTDLVQAGARDRNIGRCTWGLSAIQSEVATLLESQTVDLTPHLSRIIAQVNQGFNRLDADLLRACEDLGAVDQRAVGV